MLLFIRVVKRKINCTDVFQINHQFSYKILDKRYKNVILKIFRGDLGGRLADLFPLLYVTVCIYIYLYIVKFHCIRHILRIYKNRSISCVRTIVYRAHDPNILSV